MLSSRLSHSSFLSLAPSSPAFAAVPLPKRQPTTIGVTVHQMFSVPEPLPPSNLLRLFPHFIQVSAQMSSQRRVTLNTLSKIILHPLLFF